MKTRLILLLIFLSVISFSQIRLSEKQVINKKHIDFSKEVIYFELSGLIEIDGHIFKNDTCSCPVIYIANLDEVKIINKCSNERYEHRICSHKNCKIIHLINYNKLQGIPLIHKWQNCN